MNQRRFRKITSSNAIAYATAGSRCFLLLSILVPNIASAATYYIAPNGNDANNGLSITAPKRTFGAYFNSSKPLKAGDTLILLDGTYANTSTGLPDINCSSNANNGTVAQPITIKAQNERKAHLTVSGIAVDTFYMTNCDWYNIEGLWLSNEDNLARPIYKGMLLNLENVGNTNLRRNLGNHNNTTALRCGLGSADGVAIGDCQVDADCSLARNEYPPCKSRVRNVGAMGSNYGSHHVLWEENEVYDFTRSAFGSYKAQANTFRRNYTSNAASGKQADNIVVLYGSSDSIVENNIGDAGSGFFDIIGIEGQAPTPLQCIGGSNNGSYCNVDGDCASRICSRSSGQRNKFLGDITYHAGRTFKIGSRLTDGSDGHGPQYRNAKDNIIEHFLAVQPSTSGFSFRSSARNTLRNITFLGSGAVGVSGFGADDEGSPTSGGGSCLYAQCIGGTNPGTVCVGSKGVGGTPCTGGGVCTPVNPDGCSFTLQNALSVGNTHEYGFVSTNQTSFSVANINGFGSAANFGDQISICGNAPFACTNKTTLAPTLIGTGMNQCMAWVPATSNMHGIGIGGVWSTGAPATDVGATILYAYENGMLTTRPLWRATDGKFLGCGAEVAGVNDNPATSCKGIAARLNVNQNGCTFPAGYVGWGGAPSTPSAPSGLRIVP